MVEALIRGRSLEGGMDEHALCYLYEMGATVRNVLCIDPSSRNIQALYMLAKGGAKVTLLTGHRHHPELLEYGFALIQADIVHWLSDADHAKLTDYDGLLLDAEINKTNLELLKGRLWPHTKIFINGISSPAGTLETGWGAPDHTINDVGIYHTSPETWLDPACKDKSFFTAAEWPWKQHSNTMPPLMPSGCPWPKISIVTVTLNQGSYLEETLRSVLMQGYPNLEYIVIDGGSTDNTPEILERYRNDLTHCISEKDKGQSDALNKGFRMATGDILAWLNSDDCYLPETLWRVALTFDTCDTDMVAGGCALRQGNDPTPFKTHHNALPIGQVVPLPLDRLLDLDGSWQKGDFFFQPEVFWSRAIWERSGGHVDESLFYSMDYEFWVRLAACGARIIHIPDTLTLFRLHENQKTSGDDMPFLPELRKLNAELKRSLKS
jgi:GT2 family glycosyltransferase